MKGGRQIVEAMLRRLRDEVERELYPSVDEMERERRRGRFLRPRRSTKRRAR